ncbi:hypothetical protein Scep_004068 [Stephania cephalantha]|uniref:Uncharacterized protein n=1 Tax=Stephania cephalantha TaxID=152367 RepID=A0AAP0PWX8_9MAGN
MTENDFPNLPYFQCVAKEDPRMHLLRPMIFPHKANANVKIGEYDILAPPVVAAVDSVRGEELLKKGESERAFPGVVSSVDACEREGCED